MLDRISDDLVVFFYISVLTVVAIYGFHRYILVYLYLKHRHENYQPESQFNELPRVTVQLPMYNENQVAERVIRHCCQLDYPLDRLEIQVLDDSTDHSGDIAKAVCDEWAAKGYPIKYIHRVNRVGYKAGALAEGELADMGVDHVMTLHNFGLVPDALVRRSMRKMIEEVMPRARGSAPRTAVALAG